MRFTAIATSVALLLLAGCEQPQNVPTASEFDGEREKLMTRVEQRKAKQASAAAKKPVIVAAAPTGQASFAGDGMRFVYEPEGMRDPFRSFEWERLELTDSLLGPLEQFDVSQLSLLAVVWKTNSARGLIRDPSGQSYIIGVGARVGKNDGTVVGIDDNLVVVKETYVDYLGHETKQDVEMRIRRSEGG